MNTIPLVKGNTQEEINTSLIALKKALDEMDSSSGKTDASVQSQIKQINELIENINTHLDTVDEQITDLQPVDTVTSGNMQSVTSNAVAGVKSDLQININNRTPRNVYGNVDWNNTVFTFDLSNFLNNDNYRPWHIFIEYSTGSDFGLIIGLISSSVFRCTTIFGINGYSCTATLSNKVLTVNFNSPISACNVYIERYYN